MLGWKNKLNEKDSAWNWAWNREASVATNQNFNATGEEVGASHSWYQKEKNTPNYLNHSMRDT